MKMKLWVILLLCLLVVCGAVFAVYFIGRDTTEVHPLMQQAEVYRNGGKSLPYRIYVPENYDPAQELPLVLYLHGSGSRGRDNRAQAPPGSPFLRTLLSDENLQKYPCIVLAPQCPKNQRWNEAVDFDRDRIPDNEAAVMGLLEQVCARYPVDSARIYITGVSMGGHGTWGMLRAYPDYFAAGVPICGGGDLKSARLLLDIPIWAFHGALDDVVPAELNRDMAEAMQAMGGNVKYTEYPEEGHGIAERVYSEPALFPWLFSQVKN